MNIYGLWNITTGITDEDAIMVNASTSKLELLKQGWERAEDNPTHLYVVISLSEERHETISRIVAGKATNITFCVKCKQRKTFGELEYHNGFCDGCVDKGERYSV